MKDKERPQDITERNQTEWALNESYNILERITDGFVVLDKAGRFTYINRKAGQVLQIKRGELIGKNVREEFPELVGSTFYKECHRAVEEQVTVEFEEFYPPLNSWFEVRAYPSKDGLSIYFRDITERKRAERRLAAEHATTRVLAESVMLGEAIPRILQAICEGLEWEIGAFWGVDTQSNVLRCVEVWNISPLKIAEFEAFGRQATFSPGIGLPGRVWSSGRPAWIADVTKDTNFPRTTVAVKEGLHGAFAFPVTLENEILGVIEFFSHKICQPDEDLLNMMSRIGSQIGQFMERKRTEEMLEKTRNELEALVDERTRELLRANRALNSEIIERKRVEEVLLRSRDFYIKLFDEFPALIWRSGADSKCDYFNKSWLEFTGRIIAQEINDGWTEGIHPEDLEQRIRTYINAFNARQPFEMEYRLRHYDGEYRWVIDFGRPFYDLRENFAGYIGSCYDITDRKKMEEERLKLDKLESLGVLAGGIAHDFNNMLSAILSTISATKMDLHTGTNIYQNLTEAERACLQARALTQQLLIFSRGGTPIKKLSSIEHIIRDSASFALRGSNVRCKFSIEDDLWDVEVDEGQISQVINNIVINAQQAMPQGGVIKIGAKNMMRDERRYTQITIEDHGVGIPKEYLTKIFDPYFSTKQKGSGLGLAAAYSIIRSHDGYIDVESQLGKGTKFYVYIPASLKRVEQRAKAGVEKTVEGASSGGRVLIMDDEVIIRKSTGKVLMRMGYEVEYAKDGEEAIEKYIEAKQSNKPFDVVIMDLTIPGAMGGKEAISRLVSIDPEVRAVVSSGYSNDPVMSEHRKYGFRGVISKPYSIEELANTLNKVIGEE